MARVLVLLCLSIALGVAAAAQPSPLPPSVVDVELALRGPDGAPAANAKLVVQIHVNGHVHLYGHDALPEISATSDDLGVARFNVPPGVYGLWVKVPGVGYGNLGAMEFVAGRVARPQLSPLAAFGSVDGTFSTDACKGDAIAIHASSRDPVQTITAAQDSPGHFHIADMPGGGWEVDIFSGADRCAKSRYFPLQPGQNLLGLKAEAVASRQAKTIAVRRRPDDPVVWIRGTVRDEAGKPVAGASVTALGRYRSVEGRSNVGFQTVTDSEGRYELKASGNLPGFSASVVARAPGHPPAWVTPTLPEIPSFVSASAPQATFESTTQDFVLASKSGKLNVTVVRRGQPAEGITVVLHLLNTERQAGPQPFVGQSAEFKAILESTYPVARTNAEGVASFDTLLPGRYEVFATNDKQMTQSFMGDNTTLRAASALSAGIPVRAGETAGYKINFYEQQNQASFRIARPDGTAYISKNPFPKFDSEGIAKKFVFRPGLEQMRFAYRDVELNSYSVQGAPYSLVYGYLADSPNLDPGNVPTFTAQHVEPASARIVVRDANGKPLHVTVQLLRNMQSTNFEATADDGGEVLFTGLDAHERYQVVLLSTPQTEVASQYLGKLTVYRQVAHHSAARESALIDFWTGNTPLPPAEKMLAAPGIVEGEFIAQANTEIRVPMRVVPLRYIYGVIRSSAEDTRGTWSIWSEDRQWNPFSVTRQSTGEFIAGPFPPGEVTLYFGSSTAPDCAYHATIHLDGDQSGPFHFDIDVDKFAGQYTAWPQITPLALRTSNPARQFTGKVFLADGITPALGAEVLYFSRHESAPELTGVADALGNPQKDGHPRGNYITSSPLAPPRQPGPDSPVVVAYLPGTAGAVVQTVTGPDQPFHLQLPPPIHVAGTVTVGGASPLQRPGVIHVRAAYQGKGYLDPYLSVFSTADADGHFTLAGLTPGDYQVQAALDDIWLSPPITLHITGAGPKAITLGIPLPGAPVRIDLHDAYGKPVLAASVTVEHAGPMAELWPHEWFSDGAGSVYFPTLEAGWQTIHVAGALHPVRIKVPPLPSAVFVVPVSVEKPEPPAELTSTSSASRFDP